ncbi:MAG: hypothetical protein JNM30_13500 [Rhodospirillales bacterium]|nr:hypothetical protein [Rhodospirillales bacterium]
MIPQADTPDAIVERCSAALAERPDDADATRRLGAILTDPAQLDAAMHALAQSAAPGRIAALGLVHQILGARDDASAAYRRAVARDPAQLVALRGLMTLARSPAESEEAAELLREALKHDPEQAVLMADLGSALYRARRYVQALPILERAIQLRPNTAAARQCFFLHQELGEPERARAVFARHLSRHCDPALELHAATLLPPIPSSAAHIARWRDRFRRNVAALADDPPALGDPGQGFARSLFLLAYHGLDDRSLRSDLARLYRRACPALAFTAPHCLEAKPRAGRIKLALVSSFFRDHTVGKLNIGFVERLPRELFEVTVFAVPGRADAMTQRYRAAADRFVTLPANLWEARALIADSQQDAIFYPEIGMEAMAYMLAFARLAPLQFTTWGHPETTGIDTIDAFLSSAWLEPAGAEAAYSETLVWLDALPAAPAPPEAKRRFERAHLGLPEDRRLYACPQTLFKFHPSFDPMLAEILARDPDGLLVLLEGPTPEWAAKLARRLRRAGIDTDHQVRFLPPMPLDQYLSLCRVADVVLDPPVFGGGNSSYEAFCQDAVVVTVEGEFLRGRITAAMYRKMGLADLVPADARAYVDLALRVARDKDFRAEQQRRIAANRHRIYDNDDGVKALAAFVEGALRA